MTPSIKTIKSVCDLLLGGYHETAKEILQLEYPFAYIKLDKRAYTPKESMTVFLRDGFIDRYSGTHLAK